MRRSSRAAEFELPVTRSRDSSLSHKVSVQAASSSAESLRALPETRCQLSIISQPDFFLAQSSTNPLELQLFRMSFSHSFVTSASMSYADVIPYLRDISVTSDMISVMSEKVSNLIQVQPQYHLRPSSSVLRIPLAEFLRQVIERARVPASVLFLASAYLDRLRVKLPPTARGLACTRYRIFLASIIVASKFVNDATYKNSQWVSIVSPHFPLSEINLMERQFLQLIDYQLNFTEKDLYLHMETLGHHLIPKKGLLSTSLQHCLQGELAALTLKEPISSVQDDPLDEGSTCGAYESFGDNFMNSPPALTNSTSSSLTELSVVVSSAATC